MLVVPVALTYAACPEAALHLRELAGDPRRPESLPALLAAAPAFLLPAPAHRLAPASAPAASHTRERAFLAWVITNADIRLITDMVGLPRLGFH